MSSAPTPSWASALPTSRRRRKTHSGTTGSAARRSTTTNAQRAAAPAARTPIPAGDSQAHATPPSSRPRITSDHPVTSRAEPA